ncbi:DEAD/DEAH box helicase [Petrotoga sp. 9PW.55.5.1]|uniref:DEAD/DEAH box helicase n=1 Tax=Petrotoga sp. 9PW.55.5.1 TaxID=1308979 RepID=UPI000DD5C751|nr:DEAD/DEAH box helicase [Petrotoga sp. 9PW.55.5.1]
MTKFHTMGLSDNTLTAISKKGYDEPTPIQERVIPRLLSGENNVIGQAQTGTGKTAAFGIPLIEKLEEKEKYVQALVLTPTRELAVQVCEEIDSLKGRKKLNLLSVYGGVSIGNQIRALKRKIDIVVGTPGRIIDHLNRGTLDISKIKYLVIDEADEMLDMGFIEDVETIISQTNKEKQILMFSATMPARVVSLARKHMGKFEIISTVEENKKNLTVESAKQIYYVVSESDKTELLSRVIDMDDDFYGLVFTRTKVQSEEVANELIKRGYEAEALNGDVSQYQRERILSKFKNRHVKILIATDVAARGIDIDNLKYVINYSLPQNPENYVHRIGRTARAGNEGVAITFVTPSEKRKFFFIKNASNASIKEHKIPNTKEIINVKVEKIKEEIKSSISKDTEPIYEILAEKILEETDKDPVDIISSILKHFYSGALEKKNYKPISQIKNSGNRQDKRLFVALGRNNKMSPKKLAEYIEKETGIHKTNMKDIRVLDNFSFITVPYEKGEAILETFKRKASSRKPLVVLAKTTKDEKRKNNMNYVKN